MVMTKIKISKIIQACGLFTDIRPATGTLVLNIHISAVTAPPPLYRSGNQCSERWNNSPRVTLCRQYPLEERSDFKRALSPFGHHFPYTFPKPSKFPPGTQPYGDPLLFWNIFFLLQISTPIPPCPGSPPWLSPTVLVSHHVSLLLSASLYSSYNFTFIGVVG